MKRTKITVRGRDEEGNPTGNAVNASLVICDCGHVGFMLYVIEGTDHPHLQCESCGVTYCMGEKTCETI